MGKTEQPPYPSHLTVGQAARHCQVTRAIKIVGVTGDSSSIPALAEAGVDACLTKPLSLDQVQQELERLLPSRGAWLRGTKDGG